MHYTECHTSLIVRNEPFRHHEYGGANAMKRLDSLLFPVVDSVSFGRHLIRRLNSAQLPDSESSDYSFCPF